MRKYLFFLLLCSCSPDLSDESIAPANFADYPVNLNLPAYNDLKTKGYVYLNDIGIRGVILRRLPNTQEYYAFERNCTFHPNSACATIEVDASGLFMIDPCPECSSTFDFNGMPTGGPAITPLRRYDLVVNGSNLIITDSSIQ